MSFLPENYAGVPKSNNRYLKFEEGDNRLRILSSAITGWTQWTEDKKPLRSRTQPEKLINPEKPAKHFWAFVVWCYKSKEIKVVEITQASIQNAIYDLHTDPSWGSPLGFDLNIKRVGKDMNNTEYSVIPTPPKPLHPEIARLYSETKIDLEKLYTGGDPFSADTEIKQESVPVADNTITPNDIGLEKIPF